MVIGRNDNVYMAVGTRDRYCHRWNRPGDPAYQVPFYSSPASYTRLRKLYHTRRRAGIDGGFGGDETPTELDTARNWRMRSAGYKEEDIKGIMGRNWLGSWNEHYRHNIGNNLTRIPARKRIIPRRTWKGKRNPRTNHAGNARAYFWPLPPATTLVSRGHVRCVPGLR